MGMSLQALLIPPEMWKLYSPRLSEDLETFMEPSSEGSYTWRSATISLHTYLTGKCSWDLRFWSWCSASEKAYGDIYPKKQRHPDEATMLSTIAYGLTIGAI